MPRTTRFFRQAWANRALNFVYLYSLGWTPTAGGAPWEWSSRALNVQGYDLDIEENGVLRQTLSSGLKVLCRPQQILAVCRGADISCIIWFCDWIDRAGKPACSRKCAIRACADGVFLTAKTMICCGTGAPYWICASRVSAETRCYGVYLAGQMLSSLIFVVPDFRLALGDGAFYEVPEDGHFQHGRYRHVFATTIDGGLLRAGCNTGWANSTVT